MKNIFFYDKGIKQQGPNDFVVWLPRLHNIHELYKEKFANNSIKRWSKYQNIFSPELKLKLNTFVPINE